MLKDFIQTSQQRIYQQLEQHLDKKHDSNSPLYAAMRYSTLNGGKRLRAVLIYAVGEMLGAEQSILDNAAVAIEMIHAFSLIHDDLPAMDNDDLRRGKATCHIKFDEATAILAGDALQTLAFEALSTPLDNINAKTQLLMLNTLAKSSGANGMAGGQHIDVQAQGKSLNLTELQHMHKLKTGCLISASVMLGFLASPQRDDSNLHEKLLSYANQIGLAFQIQDDILDVISNSEQLGKKTQKDNIANKPTYPGILGLEAAKKQADIAYTEALKSIAGLSFDTTILKELAHYIVNRPS